MRHYRFTGRFVIMPKTVRLDQLHAIAEGLVLPNGMKVDRLTLELGPATCITKPLSFRLPQPGSVEVLLTAFSVAAFLEEMAPGGLRQFSVTCENDVITVNAIARILLEVPVTAVCRLDIVDGKELWVRLETAQVVGGDAKKLVSGQLDRINPIFSTDELPFPMTMDRVSVRDGAVYLNGTASFPSDLTD